ncbi:dipeptidase [Flavobacterium sp. MXW15]|uniref:Dipeptidase n=1 Tax=Xanthomonas chitinilytica TaxID=2989819 RepID=A0ABT3JXE2_9XANT|nr:dipeptidase [Xanthomonas sp. H13-6]MCW4455330.1 dipeptidase [Flavobacterium sp. MXW15]MCW4473157.1 dipeptidase [Xanthomonas sp. H13-6]
MSLRRLSLVLALALCAPLSAQAVDFTDAELARAKALQQRLLTLDSHLDTPANFARPDFDISHRHDHNALSQVDLPRMREGALDGGFWVIYTGQGDRTPETLRADRDAGLLRLMDIHRLLAAHPEQFELALNADDAARIKAAGKRVVFISMENASPLEHDPSLLSHYQQAGLRMLSVTHFANNGFGDSATDPEGAEWNGLSPAGKALVADAVARGIVIDQSHASDAVFDDLIAIMPVPFVLSHSSAKAVYDHPRNLDDARLRRLAAAGGVVQVNAYGGYLLDPQATPERKAAEDALEKRLGGWTHMDMAAGEELARGMAEIDRQHPVRKATQDDFFRHLEHILGVVGPEHVGIGMDWDGGGGVTGLEDVSDLPKITAWLQRKGYSEQQIAGIWGGNLLRVMRQAQAYTAKHNTSP